MGKKDKSISVNIFSYQSNEFVFEKESKKIISLVSLNEILYLQLNSVFQ